jgi:hypothetical protein
MNEHPLNKFWREDSGWCGPLNPTPELGLSEGTLCIETWNAAIRAAAHSIDLAAEMDFYAAAELVRELDYTGVEDEA